MKRLFLLAFLISTFCFSADAYLINEDFEGTGTPSGWFSNGAPNFDYSAVPLAGLQSLRLPSASDFALTPAMSASPEIWFSVLFKAEALPASFAEIIDLYDSGVAPRYIVYLLSNGTLVVSSSVTIFSTTVDAISAGTTYQIWGHYKAGSGSDGVAEVSFDVVGNPRPSSGNKYASGTNGTYTQSIVYLGLDDQSGSQPVVFDNAQVCDTDCFGGPTPTATPTNTPTPTATATPTNTPTATPTATFTPTPSATFTPTPTPTPTATAGCMVNEDFEGTGAPANWTTNSGSPNYDYAAVPLAGLQSLRLIENDSVYYNSINSEEVWFTFLFKAETLPSPTTTIFFYIDSSGFSGPEYQLSIRTDGTLVVDDNVTASAATVSALSAGTAYQIWGHYLKGSGSNAILEVSFDTPGNPRPSSGNNYAEITTGASTLNAVYPFFDRNQGTWTGVFDNVKFCNYDAFPTPTPTATATPTPTPTPTATANIQGNFMIFFNP